jgi:quercetin dioxygenase-like cupin family protein
LEPVLITLNAGGRSGKHPTGHPAEEFALILEGTVILTLGPEEHVLEPGDTVTILPGELRVWRNDGTLPGRFLLVSAAPRAVSRSRGASRRSRRAVKSSDE